jgi:hypothetical protein
MREQTHRLNENGRKESLDFNTLLAEKPIKSPRKYHKTLSPHSSYTSPAQEREPEEMRLENNSPTSMDIDNRDEPVANFPPPPENAVRARCYKLNLNSDFVGFSTKERQSISFGPFSEPPPYLTYSSSSEDESDSVSQTAIAIQTAQIFRGITVSRDGTILTQNARATRSNRGNKTKRGEKSRQAAKIDKAKDLVEEAIMGGKSNTDEATNMVSLFVIGEYDDMKQLVRDGSRKLREAEGLPDEALLAQNQLRVHSASSKSYSRSSQRRRVSETIVKTSGPPSASMESPRGKFSPTQGQSVPPRLKSNPKDTRSSRKEHMRMRLESCNEFMDPRRGAGAIDDNDWSQAWNLWNCGGGAGTISPMQPSSPIRGAAYEGRDVTHNGVRETGITGRAN